jgi:hypothetical protein
MRKQAAISEPNRAVSCKKLKWRVLQGREFGHEEPKHVLERHNVFRHLKHTETLASGDL